VIASFALEPSLDRVRRARFVPRASLGIEAACAVANGVRDALSDALGTACDVALGEPVALDPAAWRSLAARALGFGLPGRDTDLVFVLPRGDARTLIAAAFREEPTPDDAVWTELEAGAVERIVARAAPACETLLGERRGPVRAVDPAQLGPCVDFFDLRVTAPVRLTIGVGLLRALVAARPARTLAPEVLGTIPLEARVVLGRGTLVTARFLELRTGEIVPLRTKVAGEAELNVAGQGIALGTCGVLNGNVAFDVQTTRMRGDAP
jgi:flagellar motor switch/type III secretory pathway protein FliN